MTSDPALRPRRLAGTPFQLLRVQDLTLAQLQALHVGGRPGLRVPALRRFLDTCIAAGVRRPLAVEVKQLLTDAGRQQFLDTVRCACPMPEAAPPD